MRSAWLFMQIASAWALSSPCDQPVLSVRPQRGTSGAHARAPERVPDHLTVASRRRRTSHSPGGERNEAGELPAAATRQEQTDEEVVLGL